MGRSRYKIFNTRYPYFITSSIAGELPLLSDPEIAQILLDAFCFMQQEKQVELFAYVILENHIHCIVMGGYLSNKVTSLKSYTARCIIDYLKQTGRLRWLSKLMNLKRYHKRDSIYQVWQEGFHPKQITGEDMMLQKIEYIHDNPVKRGYVDCPEHWRYSSARDYLGRDGLIPVTVYGKDRL